MMTGFCRLVTMVLMMLVGIVPAVTVAGEGFMPLIPKGKGERCVEDTDFMRRNHMELLKHKRDETMYKGIRTTRYSLQTCISCHAVSGPDGRAVTIANETHFCNACHMYAAVKPDCFMCHASTPDLDLSKPGGGSN